MAELFIQCPGQPDQVLPLGEKAVTVGRGEDCDAFIVEKKASRRHLKVYVVEGNGVVAEDQGSSNGTWFAPRGADPLGTEPRRILRRALEEGDVLKIGDTRLTLRPSQAADAPAPLVSGSLTLVASKPESAAPEPEAEPEPQAGAARPERPADEDRRPGGARPPEPQRWGRALVFAAAAIAVLLGVELYLGAMASSKARTTSARLEAFEILEHVDAGLERFQKLRDDFAARHPRSAALGTLDRYVDSLRERQEQRMRTQARLEALLARVETTPASEVRRDLAELARELHDDEEFGLRIARTVGALDRKQADSDLDELRELETQVRAFLGADQPARAARLLASFSHTHPGMADDIRERWGALDTTVAQAVRRAFDEAWAQADAEKDSGARHRLLAAAWSALEGTSYGTRLADRLRSAAAMAAPRTGAPMPSGAGRPPGQPGTPTAPVPPSRTQALLAQAKKAEALLLARQWMPARAAFDHLAKESGAGSLQDEWAARLGEVDQILGLVRVLAERTDEEKKPRRKLSAGSVAVLGATPAEVTVESRKKGTQVLPWGDLPPADVLALLTPRRITNPQRHAVAILAASVGDRAALVSALIPLYEKGGDLGATNALVARHLYGLAAAPEGGYRHYKGEILDTTGYERRVTQERIAFLRSECDRILAQVAKENVFKKLGKLRKMRDELDKRREYALLAIFNTTHYPYPANKGGRPYQTVQGEIDRRVALVQEIWDDPYKVRIKRAGKLEKLLDKWDGALAELERHKADVSDLRKSMEPYLDYVTDEPITIREFARNKDEAAWFAYSRWVMEQYNPARREVAEEREWRQVRVTNEYRMMMGYHANVQPGGGPFEAIDKENVVKILDAGTVLKMTPLRAVRIDNRLVASARGHSIDMGKRGFFAHQAPANPQTGEGPTGPADRMRKAGYHGWGYSENIATASDPKTAHAMWCHSSGHHRNILSGWTDLGSGVAGKGFTQNFGTGGGARPEIYPDTAIRERDQRGRAGPGRPRGR